MQLKKKITVSNNLFETTKKILIVQVFKKFITKEYQSSKK